MCYPWFWKDWELNVLVWTRGWIQTLKYMEFTDFFQLRIVVQIPPWRVLSPAPPALLTFFPFSLSPAPPAQVGKAKKSRGSQWRWKRRRVKGGTLNLPIFKQSSESFDLVWSPNWPFKQWVFARTNFLDKTWAPNILSRNRHNSDSVIKLQG